MKSNTKKALITAAVFTLLGMQNTLFAQTLSAIKFKQKDSSDVIITGPENQILLQSPKEGLWSVATKWERQWTAGWVHAKVDKVVKHGQWTICSGKIVLPNGTLLLRDSYRQKGNTVEVTRRFHWKSRVVLPRCTLSVRWQIPQKTTQVFMPSIVQNGNPSGAKTEGGKGRVVLYNGKPGEKAIFEEHRFPMPFVSFEIPGKANRLGAAMHSIPSQVPYGNKRDQWWSMGAKALKDCTEFIILSGPCSYNGRNSTVKANQSTYLKYPDTYVNIRPGATIEKKFYLQVYPVSQEGSGFRPAMKKNLDIFQPFSCDGLPDAKEIMQSKIKFALSRYRNFNNAAGFNMYPNKNLFVFGWCGQAAVPGYAFQVLSKKFKTPNAMKIAQKSLDTLSQARFNKNGFLIRYNPRRRHWHAQDPLSQAQGMENFARAILAGRKLGKLKTDKWEAFLKRAATLHANRILSDKWRPKSTNEAFFISPLAKSYSLFKDELYLKAATKAAVYYAKRHVSMKEPYWGGTLDAKCEDKEGAWAAFQGFLSMYELTKEKKYLAWAEHACDVMLTYTVNWNILMPPGRLQDHNFKTIGWTSVSAQNQHLDVYGVLTTPQIYRLGQLTGREDLKKLALVMFRTCGQLIDPFGSQGEQIQQTNFAQRGNMSDVYKMRGGYAERWTVFWITAHFLNAAAQFEDYGVDIYSK